MLCGIWHYIEPRYNGTRLFIPVKYLSEPVDFSVNCLIYVRVLIYEDQTILNTDRETMAYKAQNFTECQTSFFLLTPSSFRWLSARLQYLHCLRTPETPHSCTKPSISSRLLQDIDVWRWPSRNALSGDIYVPRGYYDVLTTRLTVEGFSFTVMIEDIQRWVFFRDWFLAARMLA